MSKYRIHSGVVF